MKTLYLVIMYGLVTVAVPAWADPMTQLLDQYTGEFESLKPAENSSVGTDYKFDQIALSGLYTTRTLGLIYQQNQTVIQKQDEILRRYDTIIEQNREIIRLLTRMAGQERTGVDNVPDGGQ